MGDNASIAADKINQQFGAEGVAATVKDDKLVVTVSDLDLDPAVRNSIVCNYNVKLKHPNIDELATRGISPVGDYGNALTADKQIKSTSRSVGRLNRVKNAIGGMISEGVTDGILNGRKIETKVVDEPGKLGKAQATVSVDASLVRGDIATYDLAAAIESRNSAARRT